MKFEIKRVKNGWICETENSDGEKEIIVGREGGEQEEIENFKTFVEEIIEEYGPMDSRYSEKRLRVFCIPGDKFEGSLDPEVLKNLMELCASLLSWISYENDENLKKVKPFCNKEALVEAAKLYYSKIEESIG